ncbi:MAG: nucleotidyltransferase domain-containing protein [Coriobacteriia bacterium]
MKPTHSIESILGSRSRVAVLRVLVGVTIPLNTSQIAAHARLTRPAVASVLEDLAAGGIVRSSPAGRANVHQLERRNIYVERLIEPLFAAEQQMPDHLESDLRAAFEDSSPSIVLFGSYARGEQETGSDVDVVLVTADVGSKKDLDRRLLSYAQEFRARYGANLSAITYEAREADALWRTAPAFLESLRRDAVVVSGRGPWEWADDE